MNRTIETIIETRIMDVVTGKPVKTQKEKNLVLDGGLNSLAAASSLGLQCNPASMSAICLIGGGTDPNSIASGAVTFTQSGTTITASGSFFTVSMVGWIFKYGTGSGGTEVYITAFTNSTTVTVGTSATVSTPTVATVWNVSRTTLQTFLFNSSTYQTNSGDCGSTISGNQITHKRTYIFAQQASPYTVNEIGYASANVSNRVLGRIVLGSSDVVGTTNFYVVVISITITFAPNAPLAVTNVGTNINTAGNLMMEAYAVHLVSSTGTPTVNTVNGHAASILEPGTDNPILAFMTASYSQNASISSSAGLVVANVSFSPAVAWANDNTKVGSCTVTFNQLITTSGQTLTGISLINGFSNHMVDVHFTTPQIAPTGTFQPNTVWRLTYSRVLVN